MVVGKVTVFWVEVFALMDGNVIKQARRIFLFNAGGTDQLRTIWLGVAAPSAPYYPVMGQLRSGLPLLWMTALSLVVCVISCNLSSCMQREWIMAAAGFFPTDRRCARTPGVRQGAGANTSKK